MWIWCVYMTMIMTIIMIVLQGYFFFISNHHHCHWLTMGKVCWFGDIVAAAVILSYIRYTWKFPGKTFFWSGKKQREGHYSGQNFWNRSENLSRKFLFLSSFSIVITRNWKLFPFSIFLFVNLIWFWHFFPSQKKNIEILFTWAPSI